MFNAVRQRLRDAGTLKTLCLRAEAHANAQGHREPGAEHFVLAALDLPDSTARSALSTLGITSDEFRLAIEQQYRSALAGIGLSIDGQAEFAADGAAVPAGQGPYRSQASAQRLMAVLTSEVMKAEQARDGAAPLLGAHVLLAASDASRGVCARAFESLQATPAQVAAAARQALETARATAVQVESASGR